jgi:hypothetical protein
VSNLASTRYVKEELIWAYRSKGPPKPISPPPMALPRQGPESGHGGGGGGGGEREHGGGRESGAGGHVEGVGRGMGRDGESDALAGSERGGGVQARRRRTFRVSAAEESILDSRCVILVSRALVRRRCVSSRTRAPMRAEALVDRLSLRREAFLSHSNACYTYNNPQYLSGTRSDARHRV